MAVFYEFSNPLWLLVSCACLLTVFTPFASVPDTWIFMYAKYLSWLHCQLPSDIFHNLKLYKFTNTSEENSSVAVLEPNSQFVASKSGQRGFIGCESSTGYLDEVTREKIGGMEMTVLQPLKYDSITSIGELREKVIIKLDI